MSTQQHAFIQRILRCFTWYRRREMRRQVLERLDRFAILDMDEGARW